MDAVDWVGLVATLLGIATIIVPAVIWAVRRIEKNRDSAITEFLSDDRRMHRLNKIDGRLLELGEEYKVLSQALQDHMVTEEDVTDRMKELICELKEQNQFQHESIIERLGLLEQANIQSALALVKAVHDTDEVPTMLYEVNEIDEAEGLPWRCIWVNCAYLAWTGLEQANVYAGGDLLAVKDVERELVEDNVTYTGQAREEMRIDYTLIRPRTGEEMGKVHSVAIPLHVTDRDRWYYVARIIMEKPTETWCKEFGFRHGNCK